MNRGLRRAAASVRVANRDTRFPKKVELEKSIARVEDPVRQTSRKRPLPPTAQIDFSRVRALLAPARPGSGAVEGPAREDLDNMLLEMLKVSELSSPANPWLAQNIEYSISSGKHEDDSQPVDTKQQESVEDVIDSAANPTTHSNLRPLTSKDLHRSSGGVSRAPSFSPAILQNANLQPVTAGKLMELVGGKEVSNLEHLRKGVVWRIRDLGRKNLWKEAVEEFERATREGIPADDAMYVTLINALAICGRWKGAMATLDSLLAEGKVPDRRIFNAVLFALAKGAQWKLSLEVLDRMTALGVNPDEVSFNSAIDASAKGKSSETAVQLLETMIGLGHRPSVLGYNGILDACNRERKFVRTLRVFEGMKAANVAPDAINYTTALLACSHLGLDEKARDLIKEMRERNLNIRLDSYNLALRAHLKSGEVAKVQSLLQGMRESGVRPDSFSYYVALKVCYRTGAVQPAFSLLKDMRMLGLRPDMKIMSVVVGTCAAAGEASEAFGLLDETLSPNMTGRVEEEDGIKAFGMMLAGFARAGLWKEAKSTLALMETVKLKPSSLCYSYTIQACAAAGEPEEALSLVESLESQGLAVQESHIAGVMKAYVTRNREGDWHKVVALQQQMSEKWGVAPSDKIAYLVKKAYIASSQPAPHIKSAEPEAVLGDSASQQ